MKWLTLDFFNLAFCRNRGSTSLRSLEIVLLLLFGIIRFLVFFWLLKDLPNRLFLNKFAGIAPKNFSILILLKFFNFYSAQLTCLIRILALLQFLIVIGLYLLYVFLVSFVLAFHLLLMLLIYRLFFHFELHVLLDESEQERGILLSHISITVKDGIGVLTDW